MSDWKDIATAPKDGTEIIACRSTGNSYDVEFVRWFEGGQEWLDRTQDPFRDPTHWQPMPAEP